MDILNFASWQAIRQQKHILNQVIAHNEMTALSLKRNASFDQNRSQDDPLSALEQTDNVKRAAHLFKQLPSLEGLEANLTRLQDFAIDAKFRELSEQNKHGKYPDRIKRDRHYAHAFIFGCRCPQCDATTNPFDETCMNGKCVSHHPPKEGDRFVLLIQAERFDEFVCPEGRTGTINSVTEDMIIGIMDAHWQDGPLNKELQFHPGMSDFSASEIFWGEAKILEPVTFTVDVKTVHTSKIQVDANTLVEAIEKAKAEFESNPDVQSNHERTLPTDQWEVLGRDGNHLQ